jgi:hypothetical protein
MPARLAGFRQGLERLGWSDGRNIRIDYRFAPAASADQAQPLAKELVAPQPRSCLFRRDDGRLSRAFRNERFGLISQEHSAYGALHRAIA